MPPALAPIQAAMRPRCWPGSPPRATPRLAPAAPRVADGQALIRSSCRGATAHQCRSWTMRCASAAEAAGSPWTTKQVSGMRGAVGSQASTSSASAWQENVSTPATSRAYRHVPAVRLDTGGAVEQGAAAGAGYLEPGEQDEVAWVGARPARWCHDASAGGHAGRGDDDARLV